MTDHPISVDVERIRELLEKATAAPWEALCLRKYTRVTRRSQGPRDETGNVQICHIAGPEEDDIRPWNGERWEADAALIVALVNAAPRLIAAAEDCERLRAALRQVNQTLMVPAAEYVPAISDAWKIIEGALK